MKGTHEHYSLLHVNVNISVGNTLMRAEGQKETRKTLALTRPWTYCHLDPHRCVSQRDNLNIRGSWEREDVRPFDRLTSRVEAETRPGFLF